MAAANTEREHDLVFLLADHPTATWHEIAGALAVTVPQAQRLWEDILRRSPTILPATLLELHRTSRCPRRRRLPLRAA